MTTYVDGWKPIKFGASPELFKKLMKLKGDDRRWWEFFRDEYESGEKEGRENE